MKLLLISHSPGFYGAEKSLLTVAKGLRGLGHDVMVVVPGHGPLTKELECSGVPYKPWKYYGWLGRNHQILKGGFRLVFNVFSGFLFFLTYRKQVDLVYTNTVTTPFGALLSFLKRKDHIWHVREFVHEDMGANFDLPKSCTKLIYFINHKHTIYNSLGVSQKFNSYFGQHKSSVIYNAIEKFDVPKKKSFKDLSFNSSVNLLMVSSLHPGKGHMDALEAMPYVLDKYPKACLKIVGAGDDSYKNELEKYVSDNGLEANVVFLGYVENPVELMAKSDIFLMCSRNEAFGRVTIEALSVGCPVVGADSGGTFEILGNGDFGLLYKPGDFKSLARSLMLFLCRKDLRSKFSKKGYGRVNCFSVENMVSKINDSL